jgi:hypothetical protein
VTGQGSSRGRGSSRGMAVRLALLAGVALLGLALSIVALIGQGSQADDQRAALKKATQVVGALGCERADRIAAEREDPRLSSELEAKGFVSISPRCQEFLRVLGSGSLVYEDGKVRAEK